MLFIIIHNYNQDYIEYPCKPTIQLILIEKAVSRHTGEEPTSLDTFWLHLHISTCYEYY